MCGVGGVQDGEVEMSQESQKQVDYDYKNRLEGMMRKFSWMFLSLLAVSLWAAEGEGAENHAPLIICDVLSGSNYQP